MEKSIVLDLKHGSGGVGYRINPIARTYESGALVDGVLSGDLTRGEYVDAQKFASQLYYVLLASMNEPAQPVQVESDSESQTE